MRQSIARIYRARVARSGLALLTATLAASASAAEPTVDLTRSLSQIYFYENTSGDQSKGGSIRLAGDNLLGAFFPDSALYTGAADHPDRLFAVLRKADDAAELYRVPMLIKQGPAVFNYLQPYKTVEGYTFEQAGDYELTFEFDGKPITRLPFTVSFKQLGDAFNPQRFTFYDGTWNDFGMMVIPKNDPESNPKFRTWTRGGQFNSTGDREQVSLEIQQDGNVIYTAQPAVTGNLSTWSKRDFTIKFLDAEGGGAIRTKNLLKSDGTFRVVLRRTGKIYGVFPYTIEGGKIQTHPRQAIGYQPHVDYVPSRTVDGDGGFEEVFWIPRLVGADAERIMGQGPAAVAGPSEAERARWQVKPAIDAGRPFQLVTTDVATRMDSFLAAGDGLIAFGTGSSTGVAFMRVGDNQEQVIPDGQSYRSKMFAVCGKKIVLVQDAAVHVYDSVSGTTAKIPESDIRLNRTFGGLYKANPLHGSGNLVVTINDPKTVDDRVIIKVIDVSGDRPRVIPIKNADYPAKDATAVAVDPVFGKVAVGSKRTRHLYVADVTAGAVQKPFDLSGHDAFGDGPILMGGGYVAYADASGSGKFRMLDYAAGNILTAGPLAKGGTALHGKRYAYPNREPASAAAQYMFGSAPSQPAKAGGSGDDLPKTNGNCGVGLSAAIAPDGTVFIAGEAGIGSGEFLQATDGNRWIAVKGPDGQPIRATDVVMGPYVLAFRTGKANKTTVGYATFGERIDIDSIAVAAADGPATHSADHAAAGQDTRQATATEALPATTPNAGAPSEEDIAARVADAKQAAETEAAARTQDMERNMARGAAGTTSSSLPAPTGADSPGGYWRLMGTLHWIGRVATAVVLLAAGLVLAGGLLTAKVGALGGVVGKLTAHANTIGLAAIAIGVGDSLLDLLIMRPLIGDGIPQVLALFGGMILAKSAVLGTSTADGTAQGGKVASAAAAAAKGAQQVLERHQAGIAGLETKSAPLGLACLGAGIVHLCVGWFLLV